MMQVIPKWQVDVTLSDGREVTVWVSDHFASNVLRTVAGIDFAPFPVSVQSMRVTQYQPTNNAQMQTGVSTTSWHPTAAKS